VHPREPRERDAGVVADEVRGAERPLGGDGERLDLVTLRDVGRHRDHSGPGRRDGLRRLVERHRLHVGQDDAHALGRERRGQRPPDAARGTGHDRRLLCEHLHATRSLGIRQR
jgi:hypothetical protein